MVGDTKTDRTVVMRDPIRMVMKCKSQDGEREADKQGYDKFSIHSVKSNAYVKKSKCLRGHIGITTHR